MKRQESRIAPIRWVLVRQPDSNTTEAFFATDLRLDPITIIEWFVLRWNIEVTLSEVRAHLGVETQRQWSDQAIARSTPLLMALFSIVTLTALEMFKSKAMPLPSLGVISGVSAILTTQHLTMTIMEFRLLA